MATLLLGAGNALATERFVSPYGGHVEPFTDWAGAATNIQAAIDVSADGDVIWVANGVYATGGKVMAGDLTNRVVLDKAVTVQSVNGPYSTIIEGSWGPLTNGTSAVRCAWLTNGAVLRGFTLQRGGTRSAGDTYTALSGGGAWCASSGATIERCLFKGNAASQYGGAIYQGTVLNSALVGNVGGGGAYNAALYNCTVVDTGGFGTYSCTATNCIIYFNSAGNNYSPKGFAYCCTTPALGVGSITADPGLLSDRIHLVNSSPCRGTGTNIGNGFDFDGEPWASVPSMGCDEWQPTPLAVKPVIAYGATGFSMRTSIAGVEPCTSWWLKDGNPLAEDTHFISLGATNLAAAGISLADVGAYQVVASNALGVSTSAVAQLTIRCVDASGMGPIAPYVSWANAATSIQDAIDAASDGDLILVTNGVYSTGGKVIAGTLTNRVAIDRPLTVQSVNGPFATIIEGAWGPSTNGPLAMRCAWVSDGASLTGFTLRRGATLATSSYDAQGGAVRCWSGAAAIANCVVSDSDGYSSTLHYGSYQNCLVTRNTHPLSYAQLKNCTITDMSLAQGGVFANCTLTNCISYRNAAYVEGSSTFAYSCTAESHPGLGNISTNPLFLGDNFHLSNLSPCREAGTNLVSGVDIDGQPWANPPSMGCDQWQPYVCVVKPVIQYSFGGFELRVDAAGEEPLSCFWLKNGVPLLDDGHFSSTATKKLSVKGLTIDDVGGYQAVLSNAFGMATSVVAQVVIHCVDVAGTGSAAPYSSWATAATNIQDAIEAAAPGDLVLVTNGVYATGGKVMAGDLNNRVALTKALTVQSVNGPLVTTIQGNGALNGANAVRCAWLSDGAVLNGFTLRDGATRTGSSVVDTTYGGGAWCASTNAIIGNSVFLTNTAYAQASAVYRGFLKNCLVKGNASGSGVGSCAYGSVLNSCTVLSNLCYGVQNAALTNCIVYYNTNGGMQANYQSGTFAYSCTAPLPTGTGNLSAAPQLLPDSIHLANSSPCRAAGINLVSGTDIDGQPWANPPSIGCDEWQAAPLVLTPTIQLTNVPPGFLLSVNVAGETPFVCWWLRNGVVVEDDGHFSSSHSTNLVATAVDLLDGGSYQVVVSNASGMCTSAVAQLVVHYVDAAANAPAWPYTSWQTAASNIQDAIEAAAAGEIVLVTNGIYATGGKVTTGDLTNRVALTKPVLVQSVNGPEVTTIQGAWNPGTTNGPLAVRCAWVTNWATLSGFTLRDGATRGAGAATTEQQGGGVWGTSTNATAHNCIIQGNAAVAGGAGAQTITLRNCTLTGNFAYTAGGGAGRCNLWNCILTQNRCTSDGGGAYFSNLKNCALLGNYALGSGGGANRGTLINCTVMSNSVGTSSSGNGGGVVSANLTNSIVYANRNLNIYYSDSNCASCTLSYSCSAPLVPGIGNIAADPQMLSDGLHLLAGSPCRGAGLGAVVAGTDIDGQSWAEPPSMGCDEWSATPIVPNQPALQLSGRPPKLRVSLPAGGQEPLFLSWLKEGSPLAENGHFESVNSGTLTVNGFGPEDAGNYQMVASNAFGVFTSAVVRVVVHCANSASTAPQSPYSTWNTGATNLQDAIDAAETGEFVLVTNGVYATGGRVAGGSLPSRVALTRSITVASMSGPEVTIIQGAWDPSTTNGPLAVRCAWVGASSRLDGFTLRGGATLTTGDLGADMGGGGVFGASLTAEVINCIIRSNSAAYGGGCYQATATCCRITDNSSSVNGGGVYGGTLRSCLLRRNVTAGGGGGAYGGTLVNCTVTENKSLFPGGGVYVVSWVRNCILIANSYGTLPDYSTFANFAGSANGLITYSCTYPSAAGVGNISANSELLDEYHMASTSLCRGAGNVLYCSGTDLDGEPWATPPSMGCDEVWEDAIRGPLRVTSIASSLPVGVARKSQFVHAHIEGRATRVEWSFGDGAVLTNASLLSLSHTWTEPGDYTLTFTAYNADHPSGVSTNLLFHVEPVLEPVIRIGNYTGTNFMFTFPTQYGVTYYFERTTNLTAPVFWETIASAHSWASSMQITDTRATNAANFYRVRAAVTLP